MAPDFGETSTPLRSFQMRLLAWSSMTFACCFAHSIVDHISDGEAIFHRFFISESKLSERELTRYLNTIENNPGFVTKEVRRIFEKLPARTSSDLVTFVNEIRDGHVDLSSDPQHVISMIEARMPKLGENIDAALKMLRSTIGKMTPFSKAAFQEHWTRFFESLSAPTTLRSIFLAAFYADIIESHKTAHIAVKKEIQDLSPETDLLLKSDFASSFGRAAAKFANREAKEQHSLEDQEPF